MQIEKDLKYDLPAALDYLSTGGLFEVTGLTDMARTMNLPKVQVDTDMAMALCILAGRALKADEPSNIEAAA